MATLTAAQFHDLDGARRRDGFPRDPVSLDIGENLRPDPAGALTVAQRLALLAEMTATVAAPRSPAATEPVPVCRSCGGHGLVRFVEGDAVPAGSVPAGDGDFVRVGEPCPEGCSR